MAAFLHILLSKTNIKNMWEGICYAIIITAFFPIILGADIFFDGKTKKLYFSITFFEKIKLLRGKIIFTKKYLILSIFKLKFKIKYSKLKKRKNTLILLKQLQIIKLQTLAEIGVQDNLSFLIISSSINRIITTIIDKIIKSKNPLLKAKNETNIYLDKIIFYYNISISVFFNITMLIVGLIKRSWENYKDGK